ncbi:hypothetical protein FRC98_14425 [Lujinxingia vulgaris]|uniref:Uncharacterized protein n=1 Tax=Lujinxingia vulgaris TaxID=2600176 RepID=A0A5C6X9J7_9DELT|nr:hypothetical protein [Lujinxingia vulgaris]TXD35864.1 hypothetical protein FRC98_14425 [Lujinxingia vulgaris]
MPRHAPIVIATLCCALLATQGCASAPAEPEEVRCEECIQPPLRRAELLVHLAAEQATIAQRMSYKGTMPPPIREVAHGPRPEHPWREPDVLSTAQTTYEGRLGWHTVAVDPVITEGIAQRSLRGRDTHAAHCFFAERPNARSPIFALFASHDARRGDRLYVGRHDMDLATVEIALEERGPIRVLRTEQLCAFRPDNNLNGAMILSYTRQDLSPPHNGPFYGVLLVSLSDVRHTTGETTTVEVENAGGRFGQAAELREVAVERYEAPTARLLGPFKDPVAAMAAAEEHIPAGRFRLRPEHTFVRMPPQSYLDATSPEFCPVRANCESEEAPANATAEGSSDTAVEPASATSVENAEDADALTPARSDTPADEKDAEDASHEADEPPVRKAPAPRVAPDTPAPSSSFPTRR